MSIGMGLGQGVGRWNLSMGIILTPAQKIIKELFDSNVLTSFLDDYVQTHTRASTALGWGGETLANNVMAIRSVELYTGKTVSEVFVGDVGTHGNSAPDEIITSNGTVDNQEFIARCSPKDDLYIPNSTAYPSIVGPTVGLYPWFLFNNLTNKWQCNVSGSNNPYYPDTPVKNIIHVAAVGWDTTSNERVIHVGGIKGTPDTSPIAPICPSTYIGKNTTAGRMWKGALVVLSSNRKLTTPEHVALSEVLGHGNTVDWGSL